MHYYHNEVTLANNKCNFRISRGSHCNSKGHLPARWSKTDQGREKHRINLMEMLVGRRGITYGKSILAIECSGAPIAALKQ